MIKKTSGDQNQMVDMTRILRASESILFLMAGQLVIGLSVILLFVVSFVASPLRPLVWAQVAAVVVLILGGVALVTVIVVKYRKELAHLISRK